MILIKYILNRGIFEGIILIILDLLKYSNASGISLK